MIARLPWAIVLTSAIGAALWAGALGVQHIKGRASVLDRVESVLVDLRVQAFGPHAAPLGIAIVAIDDATVSTAGRYPLERAHLASLVRRIKEAGTRALAVDLLLLDASGEEDERDLAEALASLPSVIAAAGVFAQPGLGATVIPAPTDVTWPRPVFAGAATVGLVNIATDPGGSPRHMPMVFQTQAGPLPSFGLLAVGAALGQPANLTPDGIRVAGVLRTLDIGWHLPLRFYGPRGTIATVSARTLLETTGPHPDLDGRLVLLGATATAIGDQFGTPFDPVLPGVEVLATGIANLLDDSGLTRDVTVRRIDGVATLVLAVAGVLAVSFFPLAFGSAAVLFLLTGWAAVVAASFGQGYWLSGALPLAGSLPPVVVLVLVRQIHDRRQAFRLATASAELARFQSPALAQRIAGDPSFLRHPIEQDAAILFIDLSGFTGLSERIGPAKTREVLKAFHTLVVEEVGAGGGLVLDFMGDGAMIGFGVPDPGRTAATQAVQTALALVAATRAWIRAADLQGEIADVRVGVHFGPIVLSRLGHETQQQIAATGDCVNVASRLVEIGKDRRMSISASSDILAAAGSGAETYLPPDAIGTVDIRGRRQAVEVHFWR